MSGHCQADPACVFPGPLCLNHYRQETEPEIFAGWYCPTKQTADALAELLGIEAAPGPGPRLFGRGMMKELEANAAAA